MIEESYHIVTYSPSKKIYEAVKKIPKGRVATYGQIAELAGDKKMARAVGNALHKNPDPEGIPCFRVVNAKGELSGEFAFGGAGDQAKLLLEEGIELVDGKVDLNKYGIEFVYRDFRIGFREGQQKARELGLYMQKYCGCIFSEEDRYAKQIEKDKAKRCLK